MKTYLIIFILALCFTCWLFDNGTPPVEQPIGIKDTPAGVSGAKKVENMIPDFVFTDKTRDSGYATKIEETNIGEEADFPYGAPH